MVYALYGIIKSGRICVLVDPAIGKLELAEMMADTVPGALVRIDKSTDTFDFEKEFEFKDCTLEDKRLEGLEDVCLIVYTNASDGWAKGAMLTNENLLANAEALAKQGILANKVDSDSVFCALLPFSHLFALQTGILVPSISNTSMLIAETEQFSKIKLIADQILKLKVTHLYSIPILFYLLGKYFKSYGFPATIKSCICGGITLSDKILIFFKKYFNVELQEGYGLTEASPVCAFHWLGEPCKTGSVGKPLQCCKIKIFDQNDNEVPFGAEGQICVQGTNVMKGYYYNELASKKTLKNNWLHTGDLGKIDEDGSVYFIRCLKRMFNINGIKVYPAEVERLLKIPSNVLRVTLRGEPDELLYNVIHVYVELRNKSEEAKKEYQDWRAENISKYKMPQKIEFV
jgi:long-chain acyl-CoA synthetase